MSHVPESKFRGSVHEYFWNEYGKDNIESEPYLPNTGRYPDFVIELEQISYVVEVENDFESAYKSGVAQAVNYAAEYNDLHDKSAVPMVVVPKGHIEEPEWGYMKDTVVCLEVEHE